jgi:hypothetical protein
MGQFQIYKSIDSGAPVLDGTVSSLIDVLTACLIDGYTASVTSITRSGGVATVTAPVAHNIQVGNSVTIAGANEVDYNGTFTVTAIISAVAFTYTVPGAPATPATGVITWEKIGSGWTKPFTGTDKCVFQQGAGSNGMFLRVQDDGPGAGGAREARVTAYETMSDVDTGTHPMPTIPQGLGGVVAALAVRKSSTLDATARTWIVAADSRTFYMFQRSEGTTAWYGWMFGEQYSFLPGDAFKVFISARNLENSAASANEDLQKLTSVGGSLTTAFYVMRGHNGTGDPVGVGKHGDFIKGNSGEALIGVIPYTNPANGAFYMSRVWIGDPTTTPVNNLRGRMRGFWHFVHPIGSVADQEEIAGTGELAGKRFMFLKTTVTGNGMYSIEVSATVETN